jgi:hypothetical protein
MARLTVVVDVAALARRRVEWIIDRAAAAGVGTT